MDAGSSRPPLQFNTALGINPGGLNVLEAAPLSPRRYCQNLEEAFTFAVSFLLEEFLYLAIIE